MDPQPQDTENDQVLMDFSNMFKSNKSKPNFKREQDKDKPVGENHVVNVVPKNLTITQEEMKQRRCLDIRRWYCLSRPQYQRTCGISSVVTVWNYLFSTLGVGQLPPISQEDAIVTLNLAKQVGPHFNDIEFGSFSGNLSLITWFKNLCRLFKVKGRAYYMWKKSGKNNTPGVDRQIALEKLKQGLQTDKFAYIYHAFDHYFCPVGYEVTPNRGFEAYKPESEVDMDAAETWIIIAEPAKPHPFFTVRKWKDVAYDIELDYPKYVNIRKPQDGEMTYNNAQDGWHSQHCILAFERVDPPKRKEKLDQIEQIEKPQSNTVAETAQEVSKEELSVITNLNTSEQFANNETTAFTEPNSKQAEVRTQDETSEQDQQLPLE